MISEFALDPALVAGWYDPKEWAFYREAFTDETGRIGSAVGSPSKWRSEVIRTFHQKILPGATEQSPERQRLNERVWEISRRINYRESSQHACPTWLEKAVAEHQVRPFDGILSTSPYSAVPEVFTPDKLFRDFPPSAWNVRPNKVVQRSVDALSEALVPLLKRSNEIIYIDPWFRADITRFTALLENILRIIWGPDRCASNPKVQLFTSEGKGEKKQDARWLLNKCQVHLPGIIPAGRSLKVTVLGQRDNGENIHNRYILTNLAGVSFGTGLDVANDKDTTKSDDLCRLSAGQKKKRWEQYVTACGSYFDILAGPQEVKSRLKL